MEDKEETDIEKIPRHSSLIKCWEDTNGNRGYKKENGEA